ncbi:MAG: FAD-binding protein, partial [Lacunisphaera sp.]
MKTAPTIFGQNLARVHLLGAGGMGMAPLGLYLTQLGFQVSAEDDGWNPAVREMLERAGATITAMGELPDETQLVVFSSAVPITHASRRRATALALPQVRRGEMLAEVVKGKKLVAVAGSHGKTTTTAMLITALQRANFSCGWVLGGLFQNDALPPARADASDWVIAEIDESDGTIGGFAPEITLAVNLDWDHADHYAKLADLEAAFAALFARTKRAVFFDPANFLSVKAAADLKTDAHTFGKNGFYRYAVSLESQSELKLKLEGGFSPAFEATVRAVGAFNAHNATAALAVAHYLGAKIEENSLAAFAGVRRRQALLHASTITVYEDYAHHPTEIRALLGSLRQHKPARLVVVFQPHRFSRTAQFKAEFAAALGGADALFLMDVYAASESPVAGGTTADIYAELKKAGVENHVTYLPGDDDGMLRALKAALNPGDTVAFVGAGDIEQTAREFVASLKNEAQRNATWNDFVGAVRVRLSAATKLTEREILASKTTMRVGGPARVYAEPANREDLRQLLLEADRAHLPVLLLGRGSNLIIPDHGVDGLVISFAHENWQKFEPQSDGRIWVAAGLRLKNLCGLAIKAGFKGFEFLEGIPGSVGGALRMNAGAMGGWMFDVVDEVHLMSMQGDVRVMKKAEMHVDYRHCAELQD